MESREEGLVRAALSTDEADYWLSKTRSGGAYVPPGRLASASRDITDRSSEAFQRVSWDALKKSLHGIVNKVNTGNIKHVVVELFSENLIRGRALLVRSVMKAQAAALSFTAVYAALVAIVNTKMPGVGELLLCRLVHQFKRCYKRNDKPQCVAIGMFISHLVNNRVAHEILILQLLMLLLENPTDDSVEIAVGLMREVGAFLSDVSPRPTNAVFERFRHILHEGSIDKRVQYMIEVLFQVRKDGFRDYLAIKPDLDLVDEEDQITHYLTLEDDLDPQDGLNVFTFDPHFAEHEEEFARARDEILGGASEGEGEGEGEGTGSPGAAVEEIRDETGANLVGLRKTIYLTLMSSIDVDECGHKLLRLSIPEEHEIELCNMVVECCSQERTYLKYYGLLAERFCRLNVVWEECFAKSFFLVYSAVHKIDTGRIRNITKLFGHLLETDAIPWTVFSCVRLTEDDTSAASRIFLKFLFQELAEFFSVTTLQQRLADESLREAVEGVFPRDTLRNVRFSISFFEAIDLPALAHPQRLFIRQLEEELADEDRHSAAITTGH